MFTETFQIPLTSPELFQVREKKMTVRERQTINSSKQMIACRTLVSTGKNKTVWFFTIF